MYFYSPQILFSRYTVYTIHMLKYIVLCCLHNTHILELSKQTYTHTHTTRLLQSVIRIVLNTIQPFKHTYKYTQGETVNYKCLRSPHISAVLLLKPAIQTCGCDLFLIQYTRIHESRFIFYYTYILDQKNNNY